MIRIAVCDDESCFVEQINRIITCCAREVSSSLETSLYTSSCQLLYDVEEGVHFDLLFLDIEMPEKDGMTLASSLRSRLPLAFIVLITSHIQYAVKAYELSVFRYIPKTEMDTCLPLALRDACLLLEQKSPDFYLIESSRRLQKIPVDDILYIYKQQKYSVIVTRREEIPLRKPLAQVLRELTQQEGSGRFLLVERGYIVNLFHVEKMENERLYLDNGAALPVSRGRLGETADAVSRYWRETL